MKEGGACTLCSSMPHRGVSSKKDWAAPRTEPVSDIPFSPYNTVNTGDRVKCSNCGCWKKEGGDCSLCGSLRLRTSTKRKDWSAPRTAPVSDIPFSPYNTVNTGDRVKCSGCGCWMKEGGECSLCGSFRQRLPPKKKDWSAPRTAQVSDVPFSPYNKVNTGDRVKCGNCGCWMKEGGECSLCSSFQRRALPKKKDWSAPRTEPVSDIPFSPYNIVNTGDRVKCSSCGCWMKEGGQCSLCDSLRRSLRR